MTFNAFGARTDHFGIATANLILKSSSQKHVPLSIAEAKNDQNDPVLITAYGAPGTMLDVECTYELKSGSINLNTLALGLLEDGVVLLKLDVATDQGAWPIFKASGKLGSLVDEGTWTLPSITVQGKKIAQALGFTTGEGCSLANSGWSFSVEHSETTDGLGVPVAQALSGGMGELSAEFTPLTAECSWTVTQAGAVETDTPGREEPTAGYGSGSGSAQLILTRDVTTTTTAA